MAFENLEQANEFELKANKEIAELKQQIENQKALITEKETSVNDLSKEVDRLKIKNYEYFEQLSSQPDSVQNNSKSHDNEYTLSDLINDL